mgnify:CR=1 FL=1
MQGMVCLVTGANVGVGLETARGLAQRGATVVLACRDRAKAQAAAEDIRASTGNQAVEVLDLDLASLASVRAAADRFLAQHDRLDVLVNNAGLILSGRSETVDGFETQLGVNHLGHFLLTNLLLDVLTRRAPARVVTLSSAGHALSLGLDFDDLMYTRRRYWDVRVYCDSKLANVLFTKELARRLDGTGVVAHAVHPGVVRSSFAGDGDTTGIFKWGAKLTSWASLSPARGARTSLHVATSEEAGTCTGAYWASARRTTPSRRARDAEAAQTLWTISAALVGL